jgi:hypothetical protein
MATTLAPHGMTQARAFAERVEKVGVRNKTNPRGAPTVTMAAEGSREAARAGDGRPVKNLQTIFCDA